MVLVSDIHFEERQREMERVRKAKETKAETIKTSDEQRERELTATLSENETTVHATMAGQLPKHVLIQTTQNHRYLTFYEEHPVLKKALRFYADYSFGLETRFEVEQASTGAGLIHIRCLQNNKYLSTNHEANRRYVGAVGDEPVEDTADLHCTLYQPLFVYKDNNRVLRLRHVGTGKYAIFCPVDNRHEDPYGLLQLFAADCVEDDQEVFTFIDWGSVVVLPDLIRIKGDNGNRLRAYEDGFMDYNSDADNSKRYDYQVLPSRDGGIRLKSVLLGTYWTEMETTSLWVFLKPVVEGEVHETNTVFIPTIQNVEKKSIILRGSKSGLFCTRRSAEGKSNCLASLVDYPDALCTMEIEEPFTSRTIENIRYRLTDVRRYNEVVEEVATDETDNYLDAEVQKKFNLTREVTNTTTWSSSRSFKVGGSLTFETGIPFTKTGGKYEINFEGGGSKQWGETEEKKQTVGQETTYPVRAMSRVKGSLMGTRLSYDIPFTYTQRDVMLDGSIKLTHKTDGVFTGHNGYGYRSQFVTLPLPAAASLGGGDDDIVRTG